MNILLIGGTLFLGRAVATQAIEAGHNVTLCNRGRTNPDLFAGTAGVERLQVDRNDPAQLRTALSGKRFDAVIDPSAYFPRQVRAVVEALDGDVDHYTFVSSASVYDDHSIVGADESAATITLSDDTDESTSSPDAYGGFKAQCEVALAEILPGRVHNVRAGLIVGPHDNTGRFSYWVERLADAGPVLAPEPKDQPIQIIDVRDMAAWILHGATEKITGTFNASGQPGELTMGSMLAEIGAVLEAAPELTWVPEEFLIDEGIAPWNDLPLWLPPKSRPTHAGFMMRDVSSAIDRGLTLRPFAETVRATADWLAAKEPEPEKDSGVVVAPLLDRERERELLLAAASTTNE